MPDTCDLLISLREPIEWSETEYHPVLDDQEAGVRISIRQPEIGEDFLDVTLCVTTLLPRAVAEGIDDLAVALVLSVDSSNAGQCGVQSLADPYLWREPEQSTNFVEPQEVDKTSRVTSWLKYRLSVEGLDVDHDEYFFTLFLLEWASNTLMINLSTLEIKDLGSL